MKTYRRPVLIAGVTAWFCGAGVLMAADAFEDMTTQGWSGAASGSTPAGGPGGATDHYLEAGAGAFGTTHLAIKTFEPRWTGDVAASGVMRIAADIKVFDGDPLQMRVVFFGGPSGFTRATSTSAIPVPADGQWHHVIFPITSADLTTVLGPDTPSDVLQSVGIFMLRHQSGVPESGGSVVSTLVGFDNITAIPVVPGDADDDGDVDPADIASLAACRSGPGLPHNGSAGCVKVDFDHDGDVDQDDFGVVQRCYSGAGVIGNAACGGLRHTGDTGPGEYIKEREMWKNVPAWMNSLRFVQVKSAKHRPRVSYSAAVMLLVATGMVRADSIPVSVTDPNLQVTTFVGTGLNQPIGITFLSATDAFVIEKASGQVKRVVSGVLQSTPVLDLAVNSSSERGLLSLVLHPNFPATPFVYVRWTQSSTAADSSASADVSFLGNRVDRYTWNGSTLTFESNVVQMRARQTDNVAVPGHPGTTNPGENGNHNGGVIRFGPDGKLYVFMGDLGRRGWLQNLTNGPFLTAPLTDDTYGGPAPDNAHLTGMILRLNDDGSTPADNPFFAAGGAMGGEVGANIQKIYSYGHRNGFGMAFDPLSGNLWDTENADDAFSELNRIVPGMNGGWIQLAGPLNRYAQFKSIETTLFNSSLQQVRYPPTRLAYTSTLARSRMFMLPGAVYKDPEFSWLYEVGPAGTIFVQGDALGAEYNGTLWIGSARSFQQVGGNGGSLYRMRLTPDRLHVDVSADPRLADLVADNLFRASKFDGTESETLQIGRGFGTTPDIEQGPDGNLYAVSVTDNVIYKISRKP